ncbi:MAG: hypothetical protein IPJ13_26285 [Saprospiraceae bacterium]|nr:hypothetical protein [Saprospiraceae bacterium]
MKIRVNLFLKLVLAVLFFICLLDMPYGYFQLVRFLAMMIFSYFGYIAYKEKKENLAFVYFGLAILFQPIIKIALGRTIWNMVDVVVGIWLIYLVYTEYLAVKKIITKSDTRIDYGMSKTHQNHYSIRRCS